MIIRDAVEDDGEVVILDGVMEPLIGIMMMACYTVTDTTTNATYLEAKIMGIWHYSRNGTPMLHLFMMQLM